MTDNEARADDDARERVRELVLHQYLARDGWDRDQTWALLLEIGRAVFGEEEIQVWKAAEEERAVRERRRAAEIRLRPRLH